MLQCSYAGCGNYILDANITSQSPIQNNSGSTSSQTPIIISTPRNDSLTWVYILIGIILFILLLYVINNSGKRGDHK